MSSVWGFRNTQVTQEDSGGGGGVSRLIAGPNVTLNPTSGLGEVMVSSNFSGVSKILAGTNITLSPTSGLGQVTINATPAPVGPVLTGITTISSPAPEGLTINAPFTKLDGNTKLLFPGDADFAIQNDGPGGGTFLISNAEYNDGTVTIKGYNTNVQAQGSMSIQSSQAMLIDAAGSMTIQANGAAESVMRFGANSSINLNTGSAVSFSDSFDPRFSIEFPTLEGDLRIVSANNPGFGGIYISASEGNNTTGKLTLKGTEVNVGSNFGKINLRNAGDVSEIRLLCNLAPSSDHFGSIVMGFSNNIETQDYFDASKPYISCSIEEGGTTIAGSNYASLISGLQGGAGSVSIISNGGTTTNNVSIQALGETGSSTITLNNEYGGISISPATTEVIFNNSSLRNVDFISSDSTNNNRNVQLQAGNDDQGASVVIKTNSGSLDNVGGIGLITVNGRIDINFESVDILIDPGNRPSASVDFFNHPLKNITSISGGFNGQATILAGQDYVSVPVPETVWLDGTILTSWFVNVDIGFPYPTPGTLISAYGGGDAGSAQIIISISAIQTDGVKINWCVLNKGTPGLNPP